MISSYPIIHPIHGGQRRTRAIYDFYAQHVSEVRYVGVYHRTWHTEYGPDDLLLAQPDILQELADSPLTTDITAGRALADDIHVRSPLAKLLMEFKPDIVHIEQPYVYIGLERLLRDINQNPRIIFGSQNIEYKMKQEVYESFGKREEYESFVRQIQQLEETLSRRADLVVAVSESDAAEHRRMGARRVVVVKNGIDKKSASPASIGKYKKLMQSKDVQSLGLFVGSPHPPNWTGYLEMVGEDSSFLPKNAAIYIAGGVAGYFETAYKKTTAKGKKFWQRAIGQEKLSDEDLAGLLELADVVLLPITSGGGSNLKTAEAILADKKIVATSFAFRGYDEYLSLPNILIADSKTDFQDAITTALKAPHQKRTTPQTALAARVQWRYCLEPLQKELRRLARPTPLRHAKRLGRHYARQSRGLVRRVTK